MGRGKFLSPGKFVSWFIIAVKGLYNHQRCSITNMAHIWCSIVLENALFSQRVCAKKLIFNFSRRFKPLFVDPVSIVCLYDEGIFALPFFRIFYSILFSNWFEFVHQDFSNGFIPLSPLYIVISSINIIQMIIYVIF